MAVNLLRLPDGHFSLEFDPSDTLHVNSVISAIYGKPVKTQYAISAMYAFRGVEFTFQNEWDDPCLISGSEEGDIILENLFNMVSAQKNIESESNQTRE
jgi:hypothetical protein